MNSTSEFPEEVVAIIVNQTFSDVNERIKAKRKKSAGGGGFESHINDDSRITFN